MHELHETQVAAFARDGFLFPLDVYTEAEARALRQQLEDAEREAGDDPLRREAIKAGANHVLPFVSAISRDPRITDRIAALLGPDLLLWASSLFVKEPRSDAYVSWHQDVHYWGLDDVSEVTAWLALSPATPESGCMRFLAGSHKRAVPHTDTFAKDNLLTRGQEVAVTVDEGAAVDVVLRPGQISLHHGLAFHASHANRSADRRIGLALRYIPTHNRQSGDVRTLAALVRGTDRHGHFELGPPPVMRFAPEAVERVRRGQELARSILLRDARRPPS